MKTEADQGSSLSFASKCLEHPFSNLNVVDLDPDPRLDPANFQLKLQDLLSTITASATSKHPHFVVTIINLQSSQSPILVAITKMPKHESTALVTIYSVDELNRPSRDPRRTCPITGNRRSIDLDVVVHDSDPDPSQALAMTDFNPQLYLSIIHHIDHPLSWSLSFSIIARNETRLSARAPSYSSRRKTAPLTTSQGRLQQPHL